MDSLARLLGSSTRANLIRALALSSSPLTAYRVARAYNMNVAKVYGEMRNLAELGLVEPSSGGRGVRYRLKQGDLKKLALKLSPRVISLEAWRSEEARRFRFRAGLKTLLRSRRRMSAGKAPPKPPRAQGELETLARLGRRRFDSKYGEPGKRTFDTVRTSEASNPWN